MIPLLILVTAACADFADAPGPDPGVQGPVVLTLAMGEEARVESLLTVAFTRVVQDSRCPATALCVWAGDGAVELAIGLGMGPSYPDTLHTLLDPRSTVFAGYRLTLLALMPYPYTSDSIPPDSYVVRLRVELLER